MWRRMAALAAAIFIMMTEMGVSSDEITGVYAGVWYTVGVSCNNSSASGYARYADTSKGLELTVELIYEDYNGNKHIKTAKKSGTTYLTAQTENGRYINQSTKTARATLYIAGYAISIEMN